jgi:hypothetical protein
MDSIELDVPVAHETVIYVIPTNEQLASHPFQSTRSSLTSQLFLRAAVLGTWTKDENIHGIKPKQESANSVIICRERKQE